MPEVELVASELDPFDDIDIVRPNENPSPSLRGPGGLCRRIAGLAVGVMGAGSRVLGPWDSVMLEGVSEPLKAWSVRLCFFAT